MESQKKINIRREHFIVSIALASIINFQNCSAVKFSSPNPSANGPAATADGNPTGGGGTGGDPAPPSSSPTPCVIKNFSVPLKIIVMVDNSGSTFWTDPKQTLEQTILKSFAQTAAGQNPSVSYSFSYFADIQTYPVSSGGNPNQPLAISLINNGNNQDPIFGSETTFLSALDQFKSIAPLGNTPYYAAFDMIAKTIKSDLAASASPASQNYAVVFMSDGLPDDNGEPSFLNSQYLDYLQQNILN